MNKWNFVRYFGESKLVRSNYLWIFIIPLLAKNFDIISTHIGLDLELTFSLSKFFFASLFFCLGTVIYQLRCPSIIKQNESYASFLNEGKNTQHVSDYLVESKKSFLSDVKEGDISTFKSKFDNCEGNDNKFDLKIEEEWFFVDKDRASCFFWDVYNFLNESYRVSCFLSLSSYLIGVLFLMISSIVNVAFAFQYFFPNIKVFKVVYSIIS
ncbi:hypothetical protein [Enterovibrio calviensis]|uniref:hypothetical protein n=1 Tax=Enterovibrio calviensis TaxID=91359 RepID=UPI000484A57C|nr:hypothetical protein [Enterovibrio calviensis]